MSKPYTADVEILSDNIDEQHENHPYTPRRKTQRTTLRNLLPKIRKVSHFHLHNGTFDDKSIAEVANEVKFIHQHVLSLFDVVTKNHQECMKKMGENLGIVMRQCQDNGHRAGLIWNNLQTNQQPINMPIETLRKKLKEMIPLEPKKEEPSWPSEFDEVKDPEKLTPSQEANIIDESEAI